jgi:hypothetical protein
VYQCSVGGRKVVRVDTACGECPERCA